MGGSRYRDEPESPNEGAGLRYMMNRNRTMTGRVQDV